MIYADQRWIGNHGIGRFARQVLARLDYRPVAMSSNPASPIDSWLLSRTLSRLERTDVFFSPGYNTPLFCRAPFVFTIHDFSHIHCPENNSLQVQLYYATVMRRACRQAARIVTVSDFTRNEIIEWSRVSAEKVVNVGNGVDTTYHPEGDPYGLPFPYLLSVSNRKPHKNECRIVKAFATADLDSRIHLVFTGEPTPKISRWIDTQQVRSRVDFLGIVPEQNMPSLYRSALALIFPSLYEGFGLPILEAMACGTPVLTSNITAMPEVAGGAALLVDPRSIEAIACGMERIVCDSRLREQASLKGIIRADQFRWATTCEKVRQLL